MANTRPYMDNLIASNLGTGVGVITAAEHREVETQMLEYVSGQIVGAGSVSYGDQPGGELVLTIGLPVTLPNTNYIVLGHMVSTGADWNQDNDTIWNVLSKSNNQFTIGVYEWSGNFQQNTFEWIAIVTPSSFPTTV